MSQFDITVQGGSSVRLPTAGKYCDRDIVVTAEGGGGSVETCTITAKLAGATLRYAAYCDGEFVVNANPTVTRTEYDDLYFMDLDVYEIENVVVGSIFVYYLSDNIYGSLGDINDAFDCTKKGLCAFIVNPNNTTIRN